MKKLGFGFMRLPKINNEDPTSIDIEQVKKMVDIFMDKGFTYFDTAYPYHKGKSEIALREALVKRYPRESFTVADKMPTFNLKKEEDLERIFNEQLEKCGVEYFDYYLLHNIADQNYIISEKLNAFDFVLKKKAEGKIKNVGFSIHDSAEMVDKILTKHPQMDFVQLQINYLDWLNDGIQSRRCYEAAVNHGKPVIIMEPIKGGTLANLPPEAEKLMKDYNHKDSCASWAIRYAASLEHSMVVLSGMSDIKQVEDNTEYMKEFKPVNDEEKDIINKVTDILQGEIAVPCTSCRYCVDGCPKQIPIPEYFGLYNGYMSNNNPDQNINYYETLTTRKSKASDCIKCHKCEKSCPQHIKITDMLVKVAKAFEK